VEKTMAVEAKNFSVEGVKKALHEHDFLESFDRQTLAKFCQGLQIKTSGTKKESIKRLLPLKTKTYLTGGQTAFVKNTNFQQDIPPTTYSQMGTRLFAFPESSKGGHQKIPIIETAKNDGAV